MAISRPTAALSCLLSRSQAESGCMYCRWQVMRDRASFERRRHQFPDGRPTVRGSPFHRIVAIRRAYS